MKINAFRLLITLNLSMILGVQLHAQSDTTKVYRINRWGSAGTIVGAQVLNYFGTQGILNKDEIPLSTLTSLNPGDVNAFDRGALSLNHENYLDFRHQSDILLYTTVALPFVLAIDNKIRAQYLDYVLLYLKTFLVTDLAYSWGPPQFIDRYRPITYYDEIEIDERTASTNRTSFFSGHTSATASSLFFMAKAYSDFHPELGGKKWYLYGGATVVTGYMGYLRYRALKHFPTDIIVGAVIGAAGGVLIPHWHKKRNDRLTIGMTYGKDLKKINLAYKF